MKTQAQEMREKVIAFVTSLGGEASRDAIKQHLGIDPYAFSPTFETATKTKRLVPVYGDGVIGKFPGGAPIVLGRKPVVGYRLVA